MNPLRDISHPPSPAPNQSNFTPGSDQFTAHSIPVDNSVSISRRQETQNSLRQASVALDAAYARVTQLRHNINNLLNRMPPEFAEGPSPARNRTTESSIAPQHTALVLTGSDTPESDVDFNTRVQRLRTIINPSARQRLEDFESMSRRRRGFTSERPLEVSHHRSQWWDTPSDIPSRALPPHPRSPPLPDLILPSNNRTHLSSSLDERSVFRTELGIINPDDPNTMIGRQVAARTALNRQSTAAPPLEQRFQDQTSVIARDLASLANRLVRQGVRRLEAARQAEFEQPSLNDRSSLQGQGVVPAPSETEMDWEPTIPQSNNDPLLTLVLDVAAASDSSMRPSQPSSGASRRWTSDHADRTLLIDERGQGPPSVSERPLPHFMNARSWPSEVTANGAGEASTSSSSVRRRRRWARLLNADGDEVISDDEDGVERNRRSQLRLMYALPDATVSSTSPRFEEDSLLPYTSASIIHPPDDDPAEAIRVRLNSHQQSKEDLFSHSISSRTYSQHIDPLPTPLSEMLRHPTVSAQVPRVIPVSKHASLAGR
ncbi:uncharacterized protein BJ212DRAFT_1474969 [Suillus subaureus]|uniref:Uncharacterized protein n=1 Tax=Suillus subaureus TaxID=48587 RepID=A0A9P7EMJ9_9AGAM|nr:uncharacterized protein BJ212DRAFT_1474969 [Suillus subaureus]KAG1825570.1 hypothetical protein BJ212DRAFT_1474969 [Suillus subaureus]